MKEERKVLKWVTVRGHHVPIYEDKAKVKSVKKGKAYAKFGEAGTYKLYRVGKIDFGKKERPIFLASDKDYANTYTHIDSHKGMEVEEYEVDIKNPLVVDLSATKTYQWDNPDEIGYFNDENIGLFKAYNKLFGTDYDYEKESSPYDHGRFFDYAKYGSSKALKMLHQRDKEVMDEAVRQGYDAVIYRFDRPEDMTGQIKRSKPMWKNEVMIPYTYRKNIKKKGN